MMLQLPTAIDTHVPTARKVIKRRKLDPSTAEGSPTPDTPSHTDNTYTIADVSSTTCSSCHRAISRSGNPSGGTNVVIPCARCAKPTCVICSRKCEGPSSLPVPIPSSESNPHSMTRLTPLVPSTRSTHCPPRKAMPMRRLPLRANAVTTNMKDSSDSAMSVADPHVAISSSMWPRKHEIRPGGVEEADIAAKTDQCAYGGEAMFCKNCVKEDIASGSIACLGCIGHTTT
ncbi:hypothetical protein BC629DRAFT_1594320 [Irpex lacteus]|nr:hypothetical protein BC629DRAFT_1594320 [Irpex lacteus]